MLVITLAIRVKEASDHLDDVVLDVGDAGVARVGPRQPDGGGPDVAHLDVGRRMRQSWNRVAKRYFLQIWNGVAKRLFCRAEQGCQMFLFFGVDIKIADHQNVDVQIA
jgi:hypothetical protein